MIKINQITALCTKTPVCLIDDPRGAITNSMHLAIPAKTCSTSTIEPSRTRLIDAALKRTPIVHVKIVLSVGQTDFGFFPG